MAFVYVPNGAHMADWTPAAEGADFELPYILEPLKPFKQRFDRASPAWPATRPGRTATAAATMPARWRPF